MVDVSQKRQTVREALAQATVTMQPETLRRIMDRSLEKGDVLGAAQIAGIMAAKKKEVTTLTLADIGVEADEVGLANAGSSVLSSTPKPAKSAGEKVSDEGEGGKKIAEYLVAQKII